MFHSYDFDIHPHIRYPIGDTEEDEHLDSSNKIKTKDSKNKQTNENSFFLVTFR